MIHTRVGSGCRQLREARITEGARHLDSPHDPQARWSTKRDTTWSGYKVHLSEDCQADAPRLILQVQTTPATAADNATLDAIATGLRERHLTPAEPYLDEGYVTAEAIAEAAGRGTQIIGPLAREELLAGQGRSRLRP
ncbi:transposase [Streptosporangium amethystogenes]|uniref:transposase n=1 Tax=Streptosporangium amethystogenes TaxID=2002 RepID=UPI00068BEAB4|nr:transposase [Streptosporangium amethystogenes]